MAAELSPGRLAWLLRQLAGSCGGSLDRHALAGLLLGSAAQLRGLEARLQAQASPGPGPGGAHDRSGRRAQRARARRRWAAELDQLAAAALDAAAAVALPAPREGKGQPGVRAEAGGRGAGWLAGDEGAASLLPREWWGAWMAALRALDAV